jgi:hypothetical protein
LLINDSAKLGNFYPDVGVFLTTLTIQGTRFNGPTLGTTLGTALGTALEQNLAGIQTGRLQQIHLL